MTDNDFLKEKQSILKSIPDTVCLTKEEAEIMVDALEEVLQYRSIGTVEELKQLKENGAFTGLELAQLAAMQIKLKEYSAIGTIEECRAAMDKR